MKPGSQLVYFDLEFIKKQMLVPVLKTHLATLDLKKNKKKINNGL